MNKDLIQLMNHASLPEYLDKMVTQFNGPGFEYYRLLYAIAREYRPKIMVELGTWKGVSAACLAEGNPEGCVFTIDRAEDLILPELQRPNIEYIAKDSMDDSIGISRVDLLFIDTEHDGMRPLLEYNFWLPRMSKKNIILFDDINLNQSMRDFWAEFNSPGEKFELPVHGNAGFGVIINDGFEP